MVDCEGGEAQIVKICAVDRNCDVSTYSQNSLFLQLTVIMMKYVFSKLAVFPLLHIVQF
jgi:hypothetical protein